MSAMIDYAKHASLPWLEERTVYLTRHGSHAYGTSLPTSDLDIKGVAIPPREYFLGFAQRFEQAESKDPDAVIYDVRKFMSLAADCNPNIIEVLWTDPADHLKVTPAAERLLDAREAFLSRNAKHTFSGYAIAQLKRINAHHRWLRNPPTAPPTRAEYGLPARTVIPKDQLPAAESAVRKRIDEWNLDLSALDVATRLDIENKIADHLTAIGVNDAERWNRAARSVGYDENFIHLLDKERVYTTRLREWGQYQTWKATRNPVRAEIEARWGYDCKNAMHLVRLLRMCREILEMGRVIVRRPDREELLAIRHGAWTYERLVEWADAEDKALDEVAARSPLPRSPDRARLDALCVSIVESAI